MVDAAADVTGLSLVEVARLIARRKLSSGEVTRACLDRIERYGGKLVAVAGTTPIVVRLFHIHRPISKDELLNGIMRLLEVPYYGPGPDWDKMAGNWGAFVDAIGDLEWLGGTPEHGVVLVVTLIGPSDLATDELVSTLVDIWESRAEEVWNPKIRAPYHLVLAERGSRD